MVSQMSRDLLNQSSKSPLFPGAVGGGGGEGAWLQMTSA